MSLWTSHSGEFQHEALFYAAQDELISELADFVADGLVRGEPALLALSEHKLGPLRDTLGGDQEGVRFLDMDVVGANPARLIPAYRELIAEVAGDGVCRGVGEPVGPQRHGDELAECHIHEFLCNIAFADCRWWVLCPYDTTKLDVATVEYARRSHPWIVENRQRQRSQAYEDVVSATAPLGAALAPAPPDSVRLVHDREDVGKVRAFIASQLDGATLGLTPKRVQAMTLAVDLLIANPAGCGSCEGVLRLWRTYDAVVSELRLPYAVTDPLVGREDPDADPRSGPAFRAANELCDLVQVRSDDTSTTVRLHMRL